jgi:hypothetical protein
VFLEGDTVSSDMEIFDLKIYTSIAADDFCGLHNDKYTKFFPHKKCRYRDNHLKGTSHRKEESDLV